MALHETWSSRFGRVWGVWSRRVAWSFSQGPLNGPKVFAHLLVAASVLTIAVAPNAGWTEEVPRPDTPLPKVQLPAGDTILMRAPLGATPSLLGLGYSADFSEFDDGGAQRRVFPEVTKRVPTSRHDLQTVKIDNELKLKGAARFLFAGGSMSVSGDMRYISIQFYHLTEVVSLVRRGAQRQSAAMVAQSLYYGHSFTIVVAGKASLFSADVAAEIFGLRADLDYLKSSGQLSVHAIADGYDLRPGERLPVSSSPTELVRAFVAGKPQPIFVEFRLLSPLAVAPIAWTEKAGADQKSGQGPSSVGAKCDGQHGLISVVGGVIEAYEATNGDYPEKLESLTTGRNPKLKPENIRDACGRPLHYRPGAQGFRLCAIGSDGLLGTADDICYGER